MSTEPVSLMSSKPRRRGRLILLAAALAGGTTPALAAPQVTTIHLPDWGLDDPSRVRQGQLSLIDQPGGSRLVVYSLRERSPQPATGEFRGAIPDFQGNSLLVDDFAAGTRNRLGGYFNTFQRAPSRAQAAVATAADGRRALRLQFARQATGYCGLWVHLFDFTAHPNQRRYLDSQPFSNLSFWVRGVRGGEQLLLKIADAEMERREDAFLVGHLDDFLAEARVDTVWRQAVVPLSRLPRQISRSRLASLVLEAATEDSSAVYVSSLAFSLKPQPLPALPEPAPPVDSRRLGKATWVWNTAELLEDEPKLEELRRLVAEENIDHVFLQLPGPVSGEVPTGEIVPDSRLRPLLADWTGAGVRVYALDGYAGYALPGFHARVLKTIDNVIRFNRESNPEERFYGIRYDIEPYLLPGFHGPRRDAILRNYLELTAASARKANAAGLAYGVDIPFWYDTPDEYTYQPVMVAFSGSSKPVSHHLIDLVDDLTVMDYRTTAYGADGTVRHADGELAYAAAQGKRVFVGLETSPLPDELLLDFSGKPGIGLGGSLPAEEVIVMATKGDSTLMLVVAAAESAAKQRETVARQLRRAGGDPQTALWWPISRRVDVPGDRLSFSRLGAEPLRQVIEETAFEFRRHSSFAGFALHHAASYQELREDLR